ncbi:class II aaRS and biotin synthetase [Ascodesmis nigricans]|uniref:threonine--tRNA ligase n=1 Tax=Ascodesmis nigricans TaxID=341454 RepID=A0A4S2N1A6_9PEZI|nr:class II aaRS and biotin synthetase [Ascodesmis nigricans]
MAQEESAGGRVVGVGALPEIVNLSLMSLMMGNGMSGTYPRYQGTLRIDQNLLINSQYTPGSPLFLPSGAHIYNKLISFLRAQYVRYGFQEVLTPNIYKAALWETSGHWENYKDDMFQVSGRGVSGVQDEGDQPVEYGLKPMNCPGHCVMFSMTSGSRSFRDMPVRYADFSPLHRNEISGALTGLTRLRRFHQDDGHIFCRPSQIVDEIQKSLEFIETVYNAFHLPKPEFVLSTRPENFMGDIAVWNRAEEALQTALNESGQPWTINEGDGAFYGPKIDIILTDSDGKKHQTATVQLDFQLPERFDLTYKSPAPELEAQGIETTDPEQLATSGLVRPVIIHRAVLGSLERFMALLMEHYRGRWPFWISPKQCKVIPVDNRSQELIDYAKRVQASLSGLPDESPEARKIPVPMSKRAFKVDIDESADNLKKKIVKARKEGYTFLCVVGMKDLADGMVALDVTHPEAIGGADVMGLVKRALGAEGSERVRAKPEAVYDMFKQMEDGYH